MRLGYARVSTEEKTLGFQIAALRSAGAECIYEDVGVPGSAVIKPAYNDMLRRAQAGDEIIVWRLDRLSRSLSTLMLELQLFGSRKFAFRSLSEEIETVTPTGQMFFHMVDAFVRFERDVMAERSIAALAAPTGATRQRGRPPTISDEQWSMARKLMAAEPPLSVAGAAKLLGVSRQAVHKRLKAEAS